MNYEITHIRLSEEDAINTNKITQVKLADGSIQDIPEVVKLIEMGHEYSYTIPGFSLMHVEVAHPLMGDPYIQTRADQSTTDTLLNLPTF